VKVTRIAYSRDVNAAKYARLVEQARRLGVVRSLVWNRYGSVTGAALSDREVRDTWMADGTAAGFGVLSNARKETVRDAIAGIRANREAAKAPVERAIRDRTGDKAERKRLYTLLTADRWAEDPYLSRMMRKHWKRGHNHTGNQIIIRADNVRVFTLTDGGDVWREGRVEVHYQVEASTLKPAQRPCGDRAVGVDKGYTEVLTDSDGQGHGELLGQLLTVQSDHRKAKGQRRAKLRSVAEKARERGDHAKADRIARHNLGTVKRERRDWKWKATVRTETFTAVHAVVDKAATVVAEDLTKTFAGRKPPGRNMNRRIAAWTKGVIAEALTSISERRGSALVLVNAAYTSQVVPCCNVLGRRNGDRLHCTEPGCGVVWQADHAAAINVLSRHGDPDITLWTPHPRVKQILLERADRQRTRLPVQDSSPRAESESSDLAHAQV
jgi:IS605 OrfB family transposase